MKKRAITGWIAAGLILVSIIGGASANQPQATNLDAAPSVNSRAIPKEAERIIPVCDGTIVTKSCEIDGVAYETYVYHAAVKEVSHEETTTTYEKKVASYCTLCNDGTYSPSCATGRGACSHHGGVAQWNAPRYINTPIRTSKIVVDAPAQEAYYEKVAR